MGAIGKPERIITVTPLTNPVPQRTPVVEPIKTPVVEPVKEPVTV